jgi:RNA polymerase sigma-70 factor (ECF subfamily)
MTSSQDGPNASDIEQSGELTSTIDLLDRFKSGDEGAVNLLVERSLPPLRRWARGRLPSWARSLADTQDLVQTAVIRALPHLKHFEARQEKVQRGIYDEVVSQRIHQGRVRHARAFQSRRGDAVRVQYWLSLGQSSIEPAARERTGRSWEQTEE